MENRKDYEKRLGERLEAAYMQEDIGPVISREEFHRLIQTAEKKKKHRRTMLSLAAACVALCLVCGGFVAGMTMRESASAGKDDETKTVQQGGSVVIGSGVSQNDQNVGVSTKTYTNIEDIPEDIRKEIHFLDSDEFELEKVKVEKGSCIQIITSQYFCEKEIIISIKEEKLYGGEKLVTISKMSDKIMQYMDIDIYEESFDKDDVLSFCYDGALIKVLLPSKMEKIKKEAIIKGLIN